jgi:hypothetical protein
MSPGSSKRGFGALLLGAVAALTACSIADEMPFDRTKGGIAREPPPKIYEQWFHENFELAEGYRLVERIDSPALLICNVRNLCLYPQPTSADSESILNRIYVTSLDLKYRTQIRAPYTNGEWITLSPDQTMLATVGGFTPFDYDTGYGEPGGYERIVVGVTSLIDGRLVYKWKRGEVVGLASHDPYITGRPLYWSPDGEALLVPVIADNAEQRRAGGLGSQLMLWRLKEDRRERVYAEYEKKLMLREFVPSPDFKRVLVPRNESWTGDGELMMANLQTGEFRRVEGVEEPLWVAWHPDGERIAVSSAERKKGTNPDRIYFGRPEALSVVLRVKDVEGSRVFFDPFFDKTGERLFVTDTAGFFVYGLSDRKIERIIRRKGGKGSRFAREAWSPNGRFLGGFLHDGQGWCVTVIDLVDKSVCVYVRTIVGEHALQRIAFVDRPEVIEKIEKFHPNYRNACLVMGLFVKSQVSLFRNCRYCMYESRKNDWPDARALQGDVSQARSVVKFDLRPHSPMILPDRRRVTVHEGMRGEATIDVARLSDEVWELSRATVKFEGLEEVDVTEHLRRLVANPRPLFGAEPDDPDTIEAIYEKARQAGRDRK